MSKLPKMTVEKSKKLAPAKYEGKIMSWDARTVTPEGREPITFADVNVAIKDPADGEIVTLKTGFAVNRLTPDGKLGKLMQRFGTDLTTGKDVDTEAFFNRLIGQTVTLKITSEKTDTGEFSRIDPDSIAPAQAATPVKK